MTPSYRDGHPQAAIALLTLFFDPDKASCPGSLVPDPQRPAKGRPPAAVSGHDERPAGRAERLAALSVIAGQQVPFVDRRAPAAVQ